MRSCLKASTECERSAQEIDESRVTLLGSRRTNWCDALRSAGLWPASFGGVPPPTKHTLNVFCQPLGQPLQSGRAVLRVQPHLQQTETFGVPLGGRQCFVQFPFAANQEPAPGSQYFRQLMVLPGHDVIVS